MLRQRTETDEPRAESGDDGGILRKGLPFALAFAMGFVLGRQRGDGAEAISGEEGGLSETAREVRERATPGESEVGESVESESAESETAETETAESESAEPETAETDEEVAALSPPTTHGIPMLGLGTYQIEAYDECVETVGQALRMGYRHIDTAEGYDNEDAVGDAVADSDVDRDDVFLATKVSPDNLDYDHVLTSAADSFERLGVDFVDLLYVHWPTGEYETTDTLEAFAELREEGLIGEIGVSNFTVDLLEEAVEVSEEPIFANQVEMHPLLPQTELQQFCAQDDVDVELVAYSPIARGDVSDVDELQAVAEKHDATPQQVSLAWLREKEVTAIPKATSEDHLRENWLSLDVELDDEDVEKIDSIEERRRIVDPDKAPWNQ